MSDKERIAELERQLHALMGAMVRTITYKREYGDGYSTDAEYRQCFVCGWDDRGVYKMEHAPGCIVGEATRTREATQ